MDTFLYPTLPGSFGRDTKSRWSLLSGVYARGSKISHTGGKCVTCRGLRILPGQQWLHNADPKRPRAVGDPQNANCSRA